MAKVLLTYDVKKTSDTIHKDLKEKLIKDYNFLDYIVSDKDEKYLLPNTTLRKPASTREQASMDFLNACKDVAAKWEKYVVVEYLNSTFSNQKV